MNPANAEQIIALANNLKIPYEDFMNTVKMLAPGLRIELGTDMHRRVLGLKKIFSIRNQYILEAFKVQRGFKSRDWVHKDELSKFVKIRGDQDPVTFSIIKKDGKKFDYCVYNRDQIELVPDYKVEILPPESTEVNDKVEEQPQVTKKPLISSKTVKKILKWGLRIGGVALLAYLAKNAGGNVNVDDEIDRWSDRARR